MAAPTLLEIDATQETLTITADSRDASAIQGRSIETGTPTDQEVLTYQSSSDTWIYQTVTENVDDRVAALIQDSAAGGLTWTYDDSAGTLTPAYVGDSTLVTTGALNSGSITSGFGNIDVGSSSIDGGTITADTAFVGNLTGNASGTAATVTSATQAAITTAANLVTVGTIGSGLWQGSIIQATYGGSGLVGATDGTIAIADGSGAPTTLDVGSSSAITILGAVATGSWTATPVADAYVANDLTISGGTVNNSVIGGSTAAAITGTTLKADTSLELATGATVTGIDNGSLGTSATLLATAGAIRTYVDAQVTAQDLDVISDSGTIDIDLDSESLTLTGGTGIDTSATGTTVTYAIDDSTVATLAGSQTLTNKTISGSSNTLSNIANGSLTNSSVNYGGVTLSLGGSDTTPAFNLSDATAYTGDSSLVTVGTITSGTWQGTTVAVNQGGTGATSLTDGGVLLGSGTGAITATSVLGDGEILIGDASGDPATLDVGSSSAITILGTVATGVWNGTAIANANLANSTVSYGGISLALGASDATPAFNLSDATAYTGDSSLVTVGTITSGTWQGTTVAVNQGGTGATSLTDGGVLFGSGTGAITASAVLGDGEILIGDGSTDPAVLDVGSSTAITILGTVATGVWNGTAITGAYIDPTSSPLANTKIWIGSASNVAAEFALSGDATMTAGGVVSVAAPAGDLTGTELKSTVVTSSLTSVGTLTSLGTSGDITVTGNNLDIRITGSSDGSQSGLYFRDDAGTDNGRILYRDPYSGDTSIENRMDFYTANSHNMTLDKNGNLGIGTDAPGAPLHIYKDLAAPDDLGDFDNYHLVVQNATDTGKAAGILLTTSANEYGGSAIVHYDTGSNGIGDMVFYTKQSTSAEPPVEVMRLDEAGNVGISTTSPRAIVDFGPGSGDGTLSQTLSQYQAVFEAPQGTGDYSRNIAFAVTTNAIAAAINAVDEGGSSATGLALATGTAGSITNALTIDSSQNVLVELTTADVLYTLTPKLQVETTGSDAGMSVFRNENGAGGPYMFLGKSRGTSVNSDTIVQDNDVLGSLMWVGADGSDRNSHAASIIAYVDGSPGTDDMPGRLELNTSADGAASPTLGLRIDSSQDVNIPNGGLAIGTTSSPAGLLSLESAGDTFLQFELTGTGANVWNVGMDNNDGAFKIIDGAAGTTPALTIDTSGNVGIGTTSPQTALNIERDDGSADILLSRDSTGAFGGSNDLGKLQWGGNDSDSGFNDEVAYISGQSANDWTSSSFPSKLLFATCASGATTPTVQMLLADTGRLVLYGDLAVPQGEEIFLDGGGNTYIESGTTDRFDVVAGGTTAFWVYKATGQGYTNDVKLWSPGDLELQGSIEKTSGTFKIDHPLPDKKDTHHLVHSFIEGPRADLIYRGTVDLSGGYAQVDLDDASGMTEGTFEALTRDHQCWIQNDSGWSSVRGSVEGNTLTVECEATDSDDTVSWMVVAERCDPHIYETGWTDDDGRPIVEPEKPEEEE